ncbi:MAG: undecaprenyl-diphosphate phosphatase [Treponemataceae bacterium]
MSILQALILGIIQGIGEFLPISSSGHLSLIQRIFNLNVPLIFDIYLHLATLLAVLIVFRKKIWELICVIFRFIIRKPKENDTTELKMILSLLIATIITGFIGILVSKVLPDLPIQFVYMGWLFTAFALILSSRIKICRKNNDKDSKTVNLLQGIIIGFAQGLGCFPGISRSGTTISASLLSGVNREIAGEFSFLLSIPAILGAFILEFKKGEPMPENISLWMILISCAAAFISGILSLIFLLKLIKKGKLEWFAYYLIPLAIICFIFVR